VQGSALAADEELLGGSLDGFELARALTSRVQEAVTRPMLLVIDDADDLDDASRRALGYLVRRLPGSPLRLLLGVLPLPPADAFEGIAVLALAPIPVPELIALGTSVHGHRADPAVLDVIARTSGGSPLAFLSVLEALPDPARHGRAPLPVPLDPGPRLTEIVEETLGDLAEPAVRAVRALGASFLLPVAAAEQLTGTTIQGFQELEARRIVARRGEVYEVVDPAAALVLYWATPTEERVRGHEELRRACQGLDAGLEAWHASHLAPSPAQAEPLLARGRELLGDDERMLGIRMIERSLSLASLEQLAPALEEIIGDLLLAAELDHARRYLQMVLAVGEGRGPSPRTATFRLLLDGLQDQTTDPAVVREALAAFGDSDPQGCLEVLLAATALRLYRFEVIPAERLLARIRDLGGAEDPSARGAATLTALMRDALEGREVVLPADLVEQAEAAAGVVGRSFTRVLAARALGVADRYDEAIRLLARVVGTATAAPRLAHALALDSLYTIEMRAGRVGRAREAAERAGTGPSLCGPLPLNQLLRMADLALADGDRVAARGHLRELVRRLGPGSSTLLRTRATLQQGRTALAEGDPATAIRFLRRGAQLAAMHRNPTLHRYHDVLIEALQAVGRTEEAHELLEELAALAEQHPSRWATRALARSRALLGEGRESLARYAETLAAWPPGQDEMLRMRTQIAYAEALTVTGRSGQGLEMRRSAAELLAEAGARRVATAEGLPAGGTREAAGSAASAGTVPSADTAPSAGSGAAGTRGDEEAPSGLAILDERERPVVELLLRGRTNQAIAKELFLSVRTVEMRLTGVYRKFGVPSRYALMSLLRPEE
jgi:DNA-binding CsgD family transcriptional regulator/tetratricopeptide (TPR) repeat protein